MRSYRLSVDPVLAQAAVDAAVLDLDGHRREQQGAAWTTHHAGLPADRYPNLHRVREHLGRTSGSAFPEILETLIDRFAARLDAAGRRRGPPGWRARRAPLRPAGRTAACPSPGPPPTPPRTRAGRARRRPAAAGRRR